MSGGDSVFCCESAHVGCFLIHVVYNVADKMNQSINQCRVYVSSRESCSVRVM